MAAINLSDLRLSQPLPIQLGQVANYVAITDPAFPALSTTVVNGYDSQGNALSSVQVFPRTAKLVCNIDNIADGPVTIDSTLGQNIQIAQVTSLAPLLNDNSTFPALSTTVVNGFYSFGGPISSTQVFPRTVEFYRAATPTLDVNIPLPIQLGQVGNYFPVSTGIPALSTTVVDGFYSTNAGAISSVQIDPRNVSLKTNIAAPAFDFTLAAPLQLVQVTNYVPIDTGNVTYPPLETTVVNGYYSTGTGPISSNQVFQRTTSLVHILDPATQLDVTQPLTINEAQIGNYVPLYNTDATYPALSTTVVNGFDSFGNAISAVQALPRTVSLVYVVNP